MAHCVASPVRSLQLYSEPCRRPEDRPSGALSKQALQANPSYARLPPGLGLAGGHNQQGVFAPSAGVHLR